MELRTPPPRRPAPVPSRGLLRRRAGPLPTVLGGLLLATGLARAQEPPVPADPAPSDPLAVETEAAKATGITYADAIRGALAAWPTLHSAEVGVTAAEGAMVTARGTFDPTLSLDGGGTTARSESTSAYGDIASETSSLDWNLGLSQFLATGTSVAVEWTNSRNYSWYRLTNEDYTLENETDRFATRLSATVSQSLLEGFRTAYNLQAVRQAARDLDAAEAYRVQIQLRTVAETAAAYWELYYSERLVEISEQALAVAEEERRVVDAMVSEGLLAPMERARVEAAVVQARTDLIEARNNRDAASDALSTFLGRDPGPRLATMSEPDSPLPTRIDPDRAVEVALNHNPELTSARIDVQSAEEALSLARHARLPELSAVGDLSLGGYEDDFSLAVQEMFDGGLPQWYLGGELSVPLGNRADRGEVTQASAALEQARDTQVTTRHSVVQQVRAQVRILSTGSQKVELARANLRYAEQTLAAQKALQREGRAIQKDVLEAQSAVVQARVGLASARTEYAKAMVELGRLQGRIEGVAR